ncbi:MAG: MMPL family transporter [Acidobacteria bacterium]|nr:MMPL family transporter [Acidobacteriota bacterium]
MNKFAEFVVLRAKFIIAVTLALTLGFAAALVINGVKFNGSPETLARNDEALAFFHQTQATFGDDRVIIVAFTTNDIFTSEAQDRLYALTSRLAAMQGVSEALSLANLKDISREEGGIVIDKLLPTNATTAQLQQRKNAILQDPLYARHYIAADARTAAINVFLKPLPTKESHAVALEIERVVKAESRGDLWLAGVPLMDVKGVNSMVRDVLVLSPLAAILCFLVFFGAFRNFWGAVLPTIALLMGLIWTIGFMGMLGKPITIATLSLPTVLMAVGSSYIFHVLNQYKISMSSLAASADRQTQNASWLDGLRFILPAVFVSGATTIAGFASLTSSPVPAAKDMGLFEATGVAFMLLLTLAFIPAVLTLLPQHSLGRHDGEEKDYALWMNPLLKHITALILFRRRSVLFISLAATLFLGVGVYWMRVNTDYLKIFPRDSEISQTAAKLHEQLAGASVLQIVVSGNPDAATSTTFMQNLAALEQFALEQPGVDAAISVADIVKKFNQALPGKPDEQVAAIPHNAARLQSIFNNYLSQDEALNKLVNRDRSTAVIVLRTNLFGSNEIHAFADKIKQWQSDHLPQTVAARLTGSFILLNDASDAVASSQASSLVIALITIYLMMVLMFRSFATGFLALLPNLLPIFGYFGFLGWTATTLDITTSLIASSVLGLAVDNAVHMIRRYRQAVAECQAHPHSESSSAEGWAMWLTMHRTGKPMTLANLMLIAAFLIFTLSSFVPVRTSGLLWAITILACLVADLIFLPALMKTKLFHKAALGNASKLEKQLPDERKSTQGVKVESYE